MKTNANAIIIALALCATPSLTFAGSLTPKARAALVASSHAYAAEAEAWRRYVRRVDGVRAGIRAVDKVARAGMRSRNPAVRAAGVVYLLGRRAGNAIISYRHK